MADFSAGYIVGIILSGLIMFGTFFFILSNEGRIVIQKSYADDLTACKNTLLENQAVIKRTCPDVKCSFPSFMYVMSSILLVIGVGIYIYALSYFNKREEELKKIMAEADVKIDQKHSDLAVPLPLKAPVIKQKGDKHGRNKG